jgi:predicted TIM-barrel fold metal-dependent hydrolase
VAPYRLVDADNHYYEPYDCFTRHIESKFADRAVNIRKDEEQGLGKVYIGDERLGFMSVIQTDHVGAPGALQEYLTGKITKRAELSMPPIRAWDHPAFMERNARLSLMDEQGIEAAIMLPTLGVCVEHELSKDVGAAFANLRAFNRWLEEDWGYQYDGRLFSVPMLSLLDVDMAVAELRRVLDAGARLVALKVGPVYGRSPADPQFDQFWALAAEAGVPVVFHVGNAGYDELYSTHWGEKGKLPVQRHSAFQMVTSKDRPIIDTLAALVLHNLFGRHPDLKVMSIENGSEWVPGLLKQMDKAADGAKAAKGVWLGGRVEGRPSDIFREHIYVCPFHEDDVRGLIECLGVDRVLFGSDYPHPEGIAEPASFTDCLEGLDAASVQAIMRDNTADLLRLSAS